MSSLNSEQSRRQPVLPETLALFFSFPMKALLQHNAEMSRHAVCVCALNTFSQGPKASHGKQKVHGDLSLN